MNAVLTLKKVITVTVSAAALTLAGSGCTTVTSGVAVPDRSAVEQTSAAGDTAAVADAFACTEVDEHMVDIPAVNADEPRLRIPQPDGWEGSTEVRREDPLMRFSLEHYSSASDEKPRNIVLVGIEEVPDAETEAIFTDGHAGLVAGLEEFGLPTDLWMSGHTVCGLPAETYTYGADIEAPPVSYLQVVARTDGRAYLVVVLAMGAYDSPTFERDAETILTGFEVLPPANAST